MAIQYTITVLNNYVAVKPEGTVSHPDQIMEYIDSFLKSCKEHNLYTILMDHRSLQLELESPGSFETAARAVKRISADQPVRVAIVTPPARLEQARIYETIGVNLGSVIKAFSNREMAAYWLTGTPTVAEVEPTDDDD